MDETPAQQQEDDAFENLMAEREGRCTKVYLDTLKKPTVGIGHLVLPEDGLEVDDVITDAQVTVFFRKDSAAAMGAARSQAQQAGISDSAFIPYLASVNFQLGPHWTTTFSNTWKMIVDGEYEAAAAALDGTLWERQTPVRVRDFQGALRRLPPKQ
jgi:GH24 family phage-related lysozyme (muramidase)